jgi:hypothetical protein
MKVVDMLGDRLLGLFVPKVTASAGCPYECWNQACGPCSGGTMRCCQTPQCGVSCGTCHYYAPAAVRC